MTLTKEELVRKLDYNKKESRVYMPNEIFEDLQETVINPTHLGFAYSYIYLNTWLYRHSKHVNIGVFNNRLLKELLGYSPTTTEINYIIKKNGVLEEMDYLETVRDFPISWEIIGGKLEFAMFSDYPNYPTKISSRFSIKYPTFAFTRRDVEDEGYFVDGIFYDVSNTHMIPFEVFLFCMSKKELGTIAFYMYSYLKYKCDVTEGSYTMSIDALKDQLGMSRTTTNKYLGLLKGYRMLDFIHNQEFYVAGLSEGERKANTYLIRNYEKFSEEKLDYKRIKNITMKEYEEIMEERKKFEVDIKNNLPF